MAFAELEAFADAPMRTYSDGMRLRLAFGVIAQLEPDALLLDEVIAVGDMRFQAKCMERIRELRQQGTAVVFASHDIDKVAEECSRAVWLQAGGVRLTGDAATVVGEYREAMRSDTVERTPAPAGGPEGSLELRRNRFGSQELQIVRGRGARPGRRAHARGRHRRSAADRARAARRPARSSSRSSASPSIGSTTASSAGTSTPRWTGSRLGSVAALTVEVEIDRVDLMPGEYAIDPGVYRGDWSYALDYHWQAYPLRVTGRGGGHGVARPPLHWNVRA